MSDAHPTAPLASDLRALRRARAMRRGTLGVLAVLVLVGATGLLGVHTATVSASRAGYELTVTYPKVARGGLAIAWEVELRRVGGFDGPVAIATSTSYWELFDENGLDPQPAAARADGERLIWEFDPPSADTLSVSFDARIEPARQHGDTATTAVLVDGVAVVAVTYSTIVLP